MITTDTTNKLGTTVTKDFRTVMQAYDFNLSELERVMSGAGKVAALGHELERRGLKRTIVVTGKTLGGSALLEKVTGAAGARCERIGQTLARELSAKDITLRLASETLAILSAR